MLSQVKSNVERELRNFAEDFGRPPLSALPRRFSNTFGQFVQRDGKRLRSVLFVTGYRGYSTRKVRYLYKSAASLELLHDFILIHDDLIDHASLRRGRPSMHEVLDSLLDGQNGLRFKGADLALIAGDMMYAMAIKAFLSITETPERKQRALEVLTQTAVFTGCGELDELLHSLKPLKDVKPRDIYRIYDWKTGHYTFASPLSMGAILGGASRKDVRELLNIGIDLGRAFQIRDDLLDLYGDGNRYGKPALIDLREGKKTLPVWYAYNNCKPGERNLMRKVLEKPGASEREIHAVAKVIDHSGAAEHAESEMRRLVKGSAARIRKTKMRARHRDFLIEYTSDLLQPPSRHP